MQRNRLLLLISVLAIVVTLGISSWASPGTIVPLQQETPTVVPVAMQPTEKSWILVDLPADATQLEFGAEVYRLVCKACHGDKGQGLTDDWRAQWAPEDQNCWQSKCHGLNHPSDGFYMPIAPAVVGQPIRNFGTALNLYNYIHNFMPWHDRGSMTQKDSWTVTVYLLKINGIEPGPELNAETAAKVDLSVIDPSLFPTSVLPTSETQSLPAPENTQIPAPTLTHESQANTPLIPPWIFALILPIIIVLVLVIVRRHSTT